jgi:hypothetical protein
MARAIRTEHRPTPGRPDAASRLAPATPPPPPPAPARLQLHEQNELVWNDGVAPETAIDFDVPHWSAVKGAMLWLGGFGFFASIYAFAASTNHPNNKISVSVCVCGVVCAPASWRGPAPRAPAGPVPAGAAEQCVVLRHPERRGRARRAHNSPVWPPPAPPPPPHLRSLQASRDLPESTRTTALGGYAHGRF